MQAIKEKIHDLKEIRKAKAEAKEEERLENEVAREVRMAKEAEAAMDFHVQKAAEKAAEHEKKFPPARHSGGLAADSGRETTFRDASSAPLETPIRSNMV